jgi:hypothetical protein
MKCKSPLLLVASLVAIVPVVHAGTIHAPYADYAVEVGATSSIFNSTVGFNGSRADFGGPWGTQYDSNQGNTDSGWQTFNATFQADPGSVFTNATLSFGQWSFAVPEGGYLWFMMYWDLPGSSYSGSNNLDDTYFTSPGGASWQVGSGGGSYHWWHRNNQGGGGFSFMNIMDFNVPLTLSNVSTFSVAFRLFTYHGGNVFGDGKGAGIGFSNFSVQAITAPGAPAPQTVPESGTTVFLVGASLLGLTLLRRLFAA